MPNVLDVKINPDIVLDEKRLVNSKGKRMPESIIQNLLITMTIAIERYNCHWSQLDWNVRFNKEKMPVISVKQRQIICEKLKPLTIKHRLSDYHRQAKKLLLSKKRVEDATN